MVLSRARRLAPGLAEFRTALKDRTALLGSMLTRTTPPPTMKAVAQLAGVSTVTVSRVVNGVEVVRPDTVARVRAAIEKGEFSVDAEAIADKLLSNAQEILSNKTGVNLDEEAARLIQFQQSYQAAAKILQIAQTIFDTLLETAR